MGASIGRKGRAQSYSDFAKRPLEDARQKEERAASPRNAERQDQVFGQERREWAEEYEQEKIKRAPPPNYAKHFGTYCDFLQYFFAGAMVEGRPKAEKGIPLNQMGYAWPNGEQEEMKAKGSVNE